MRQVLRQSLEEVASDLLGEEGVLVCDWSVARHEAVNEPEKTEQPSATEQHCTNARDSGTEKE